MSLLKNYFIKKTPHLDKSSFLVQLGPFISAAALILVIIVFINIYSSGQGKKTQVLGAASEAYHNLSSAYESLNQAKLTEAANFFQKAKSNFEDVGKILTELNTIIKPVNFEQAESALHLAQGGRAISSAGYFLTTGLAEIISVSPVLADTLTLDSSRDGAMRVDEPTDFSLTDTLSNSLSHIGWASELVETAVQELDAVNISSLPTDLQPHVSKAKEETVILNNALKTLAKFNSLLLDMTLGYSKTYLIIFQNTAETRPTGGFIGSYGLLRLKNGHINSLLIESIYEIDGRLNSRILPPEPLRTVAGDTWALRDANWWPDFAVSAKNISQFYEWEGGETVDGVISFTPEVFEEIFVIIGSVDMPQYETSVNSENFYDVVQNKTSQDYNKLENKPKKFMTDLAAEILHRLPQLNQSKKTEVLGLILRGLREKNIIAWNREPTVQKEIQNLNMSGELTRLNDAQTDYLLVSNANIGGGKSDKYIKQSLSLTSNIKLGNRVENTLVIKRENSTATSLGYPDNINYLRAYVPPGATLLWSSHKVDSFEELGFTVFAATLTTAAQETQELSLTYTLPEKAVSTQSHSLILQSSPGQKIDQFDYIINLPKDRRVAHTLGGMISLQNSDLPSLTVNLSNLKSDRFFGIVYE